MAWLPESFSVGSRPFFESLRALLCAANPLAVAAFFLAIFGMYSSRQRNVMARTACWVALGLLIAFAFFGQPVMDVLGTGASSIRTACGAVLAIVSFRFLCSGDDSGGEEDREPPSTVPHFTKKHPNMAVIPLAVPLIFNPDTFLTAMARVGMSSGHRQRIGVLFAIAATVAVIYLCLLLASFLCSFLGLALRKLFFRIGGLLLLAFAFQQVLLGLSEIEPFARLFIGR